MVTYPYAYMTYYRATTCRPGRGISWRPPAYSLLCPVLSSVEWWNVGLTCYVTERLCLSPFSTVMMWC